MNKSWRRVGELLEITLSLPAGTKIQFLPFQVTQLGGAWSRLTKLLPAAREGQASAQAAGEGQASAQAAEEGQASAQAAREGQASAQAARVSL